MPRHATNRTTYTNTMTATTPTASPPGATGAGRATLNHLLPGRLRIERGTFADYRRLEHFHYAPGRPAAPAGVWKAVYEDLRLPIRDLRLEQRSGRSSSNRKSQIGNRKSQLVAVAVLAYPTPRSLARERALDLAAGPRYGPRLAFVNRHVRTIARVIVHPQFRGLGVAAALVRRVCDDCTTRYVEAFAAMGDVHPFFERGGMRRTNAGAAGEAAYFLFERGERREGGGRAK